MDTARWSTLSALLDELLEMEPPDVARRVEELTLADPELGAELRRMLALEDARPDFLAESLVESAAFAPQPGQSIGPYRLERPLGEGGMGQVWLALRADGLYHRRVALKLLRPGLGDAGLRTRFTRERQILARLAQVVELRYFTGLSELEIAALLKRSERSIRRDWQKARMFLLAALQG